MGFVDQDPLEEVLGTRIERMKPFQLVAYIRTYWAAYGVDLKARKHAEDQVFIDLQETYGKRDAGRIVKWAFYAGGPYGGYFQDKPITFRSFAPGSKWWTDRLHLEMQLHLKGPKSTVKTYEVTEGSVSLADL